MPATLDTILGALGNPQRREILDSLARGPLTTPQIGTRFGFSKQALSRHVAVLEGAGLITKMARGRTVEIALGAETLDRVSEWIARLQRGWRFSLDALAGIVEDDDG